MTRSAIRLLAACCLALALPFLVACDGGQDAAKGPGSVAGWEQGGAFDAKYNIAEFDKIKGVYAGSSEITPLPGMAPGLAVAVRDRADGQTVTVVLGPRSFVKDGLDKLGLRDGERLNAYGAWTRIGEKDVLIATKLKKTEKEFLKVRRTKDGKPFWAMTPEELAAEAADTDGE